MTTQVGTKVASAAKFIAAVVAMAAGITKDLTANMTLTVGGVSMTQAVILAKLASIQALFSTVAAAKAAVLNAVAAKNAELQDAKQFMADLKKAIESQFGSSSAQLTDFGLTPPKPAAKRTAAEKAASSGLATQTRKVRGRMGKAQAAAITVAGKAGVVVVGPTGAPLEGVTAGGPTPPAGVPTGGSTPSSSPASPAGSGTPGNSGNTGA